MEEADEPDDPLDVGSFGVDRIMVQPEVSLYLHEELGLGLRLISLRVRHSLPVVNGCPEVLITDTGQICPKTR